MSRESAKLGDRAEEEFVAFWKSRGKAAWHWKIEDTKALFGLNDRLVKNGGKPSDFIVCVEGLCALVEVKATENERGFATSGIQRSQRMHATMIAGARGPYYFAVRAFHPNVNAWFVVPAAEMLARKGRVGWDELAPWKRNTPCIPTPSPP